jgi:hypothetical protein
MNSRRCNLRGTSRRIQPNPEGVDDQIAMVTTVNSVEPGQGEPLQGSSTVVAFYP